MEIIIVTSQKYKLADVEENGCRHDHVAEHCRLPTIPPFDSWGLELVCV